MALRAKHKEVEFGVGDTVRVMQLIHEGEKKRLQAFEGMVIAIRGEREAKNFIVRRIGSQQVGIEKIFPLEAPVVDSVVVVRAGTKGVKRAKLYYTRGIAKKAVEKIYQRKTKKERAQASSTAKKKSAPKTLKKTAKKSAK